MAQIMENSKHDLSAKALQRIREARKNQKLTQDDLADILGMDRSNVSRMLNGGRQVKISELKKLAAALRIPIVDILSEALNVPESAIGEIDDFVINDTAEFCDETDTNQNGGVFSGVLSYAPQLRGAIPEVDVTAGAGEGSVGETVVIKLGEETYSGHPVLGEWVMPLNYLTHELHVVGGNTLVMKVVGDSMYPTYTPNDRVLIDLKHNEITSDGVYVISDGQSPPQIKRITRVLFSSPPEVDIVSDNPAHQSQRVPLHMLKVIGRVAGRVSAQ